MDYLDSTLGNLHPALNYLGPALHQFDYELS
ncbi:unnamed protein product [Toxocara canis]|uniref:Uncharacterized protein n=1 Tax=Toxocara canis TaxID=6265 RepID=A0A3P7FXI3_TOXCA|nr:unnamed protein product [Toxocara canis]